MGVRTYVRRGVCKIRVSRVCGGREPAAGRAARCAVYFYFYFYLNIACVGVAHVRPAGVRGAAALASARCSLLVVRLA